jgi:hypothetical protein
MLSEGTERSNKPPPPHLIRPERPRERKMFGDVIIYNIFIICLASEADRQQIVKMLLPSNLLRSIDNNSTLMSEPRGERREITSEMSTKFRYGTEER